MPSLASALRYVPALEALRGYSLDDARHDLVAGFTVATVSVPQAMAYALVIGVPPEHGLYGAIVMVAVGGLFASSRQLVHGPTNAMAIAGLSALATVPADRRIEAAVLLAAMVGAMQVGVRALRLGDLTRYVSHSVIVGFTTGAAVLLGLGQLANFLGLRPQGSDDEHFLVRVAETLAHGGPVHLPTLAVGAATVAAVVGLRALKQRLGWRRFPELLIAVTGAAAATAALRLDQQGVAVIGAVPSHLPAFQPPRATLEQVRDLAPGAFAVALLGLLEAISMAKVIAGQTGQKLDVNQQCLSEGMANLVGSLFQCFPGAGSLARSAINHQAGARTQWASITSAVAVAAVVGLFAPWARYVPRSALAGILLVAAWRLIDVRALRYHLRASRFDAGLVVATAVAAVGISIEFCVLVGAMLSFLFTVPRAGRMQLSEFVVKDRVLHERMDGEEADPRVLVFGLEGELFFGSSGPLEAHLDEIADRVEPATRVVVLRVKRVRTPDAVGLTILEHFLARMEAEGVRVILCGVRPELHEALRKTRILGRLGEGQLHLEQPVRHTSTLMAVRAAYAFIGVQSAASDHYVI